MLVNLMLPVTNCKTNYVISAEFVDMEMSQFGQISLQPNPSKDRRDGGLTLTSDEVIDGDLDDVRFRAYAKTKFESMLKELQFRCQRASLMHYYEADRYDRKCYYVELTAALIGAISVSGIGAFLLKWTGSSDTNGMTTRVGLLGLFGTGVSVLLEFASNGSSKLVPTFSARAESHKKAAAGWQRLTRMARSYRVQLRNPKLNVSDYVLWYDELVRMRETVSQIAMVPINTYEAFEDASFIFDMLQRRRSVFVRYQVIKTSHPNDYDEDENV